MFHAALVLSALLIVGCGYTIQGKAQLPFEAVTITKIVNRTYEPGLEDRMRTALVEELLRSGFVLHGNGGHRIEGEITGFALKTLSQKGGVAAEYEVSIQGTFKLYDPSDTIRYLRDRGVFIVSFGSAADDLTSVMARKELATDRALRDFSSEIVASIIYDGSGQREKAAAGPAP